MTRALALFRCVIGKKSHSAVDALGEMIKAMGERVAADQYFRIARRLSCGNGGEQAQLVADAAEACIRLLGDYVAT
ncbi:hypothetical protein ISN74_08565 [Dyella caseinilytica]|uniref:Uncharacterized protein n=1 Tax=Dyella caseinilytica TaxID=1849581 RepID=A0ABX7GXY9_9GAMM|nr:hypothetical protein [Dyella caseinilytica]QRN55358.1 hypothetical protein ISN74_08565 [Dyella caseinilytica]GGA01152.1 hypothetical protein GCM10011408_22940 [Dyella caseinilytica]